MAGILTCLTLLGAVNTQAQLRATLQDGGVHGVVQEAGLGQPVPFALVIVPARGIRVFATATGWFALPDLSVGEHLVEVRQIGFAPATFRLEVARADVGAAISLVVLALERQPLVLPTLAVTTPVCEKPKEQSGGPAAEAIIEQLVTNAERLLTMERTYPVEAHFERAALGMRRDESIATERWDTLEILSDRNRGYRHGEVMRSRNGRAEQIQYFTTSDIARKEFRDRHCFWVAGEEVVGDERLLRVDFAPVAKDRATDWAGTLLLDSLGLLRHSEASLVKIPLNAPHVRSSRCEVSYTEIIPTLIHEQSLNCYTSHEGLPTIATRELWNLVRWKFRGKVPGK